MPEWSWPPASWLWLWSSWSCSPWQEWEWGSVIGSYLWKENADVVFRGKGWGTLTTSSAIGHVGLAVQEHTAGEATASAIHSQTCLGAP